MKDRIKKLRKDLGMTQKSFAEAVGIKQNTVATYEIGRNPPTDTVITLICRRFNVNRDWLLHGIEPMYLPTPASELETILKDNDLSPSELILIEKFLTLSDSERKVILQYVKRVAIELIKLEERKETSSERDARLLREEADAVERGAGRFSASPSQENGKKEA